jgi:glucose-1-phosphate cytidylyltransferase
MKCVILAGGMGTRLMEETATIPKPMVEIGGKPILWHIMKYYSHYNIKEFVICLGYKGYVIKEYIKNYYLHNSNVTINVNNNNDITVHDSDSENFIVTLVETGLHTNTAGRIKKIKKFVENETFMLTYGDGLSNIDLNELLKFHTNHNKIGTLSSVKSPIQYGILNINSKNEVYEFIEKPEDLSTRINGGFFVFEPELFNYLEGDVENIQFEKGPLKKLSANLELKAFNHNGFWKSMDALRDKIEFEKLWETNPHWKIWK